GSVGAASGKEKLAATPSCSRRRSQCNRRALCSWTTKRGAPFRLRLRPCGAGSLVRSKSRLRSYSPSVALSPFLPAFEAMRVHSHSDDHDPAATRMPKAHARFPLLDSRSRESGTGLGPDTSFHPNERAATENHALPERSLPR